MGHGSATLAWFQAWGRMTLFAFAALAAAMSPTAYTARMRAVALRQMYFTAWQVLPAFVLFAALVNLVIIEIIVRVARDYGLSQYALELVFRVLVLEVGPLFTALLVALRSGAAISTEMALLRMSGELDMMRLERIDPFEREFVPRIVAAASSVFALTVITCGVVMALAYLVMYGFSAAGFEEYTRTVARAFAPGAMAGFALKCLAFGTAVAVIPIAAGLDATRAPKSAPVAVMGGMVRLVFAIAMIELFALAVAYI